MAFLNAVTTKLQIQSRDGGSILLLWILSLLCPLIAATTRAQSGEQLEAQVKAAFLLNFARYVEWPASSFARSNSPVVIGVLGQDPLGRALDVTVEGKTVEKRVVQVNRSRRISDLTDCHVIFIPASERERVQGQLAQLQGKPILTVSDVEGFTNLGGMIQLKKVKGTMRFDISRPPAEAVGLKISSKLLKLADNPQ